MLFVVGCESDLVWQKPRGRLVLRRNAIPDRIIGCPGPLENAVSGLGGNDGVDAAGMPRIVERALLAAPRSDLDGDILDGLAGAIDATNPQRFSRFHLKVDRCHARRDVDRAHFRHSVFGHYHDGHRPRRQGRQLVAALLIRTNCLTGTTRDVRIVAPGDDGPRHRCAVEIGERAGQAGAALHDDRGGLCSQQLTGDELVALHVAPGHVADEIGMGEFDGEPPLVARGNVVERPSSTSVGDDGIVGPGNALLVIDLDAHSGDRLALLVGDDAADRGWFWKREGKCRGYLVSVLRGPPLGTERDTAGAACPDGEITQRLWYFDIRLAGAVADEILDRRGIDVR